MSRLIEVKTVVSTTGDTGYLEYKGAAQPRRVFRVQAESNNLHLEWCDEITFHREGARARWYAINPQAITLANLIVG
jgi:hypothetical protein